MTCTPNSSMMLILMKVKLNQSEKSPHLPAAAAAFSLAPAHWRALSGMSADTFLIACYMASGFPRPLALVRDR